MAYLYQITTIINAFTFAHAKPIISEWPHIQNMHFNAFKRAIRVIPSAGSTIIPEIKRSMQSNRQLETDADLFEIQIKSTNMTDLLNICEDIKNGCRDYAPTSISVYSVLQYDERKYEMNTVNFSASVVLTASFAIHV